ncbi:hypothetical protein LAZ67_21002531 [Cordylochernes scorpioides]|uniref:Transposase n=1 Tax=Cordylochernes scorpioides TaxID=51811 RepID=A0ABY6LMQ1_9ARAC|nr:hypothetical protein LAZ67_21002531 [Cordylochernes scorpioides]
MLTVAYGEATLDRSNVYRWYKMFSEDREDLNDEGRAGRPSTSTTDEKINEHRMNIANEMLVSVRDDPNLLQRVIPGDEAWVYGYDVKPRLNHLNGSCRTNQDRKKRAKGVVHHEFLPQGRTVNKEYYLQVMRNFREAIRQKRPDLWKNKNWLLHHDNAPAHTSLLVRDLLAKNNTLMMPQPPYSPDLAPSRSPDLNSIEHVWDNLGRRISSLQTSPRNTHELETALTQEWAVDSTGAGMPSHRRSNLSQRSNSSRVQHAYRLRETRGQNIRRLRSQSARQAAVRSLETPAPIHSRLQAHSEIQ